MKVMIMALLSLLVTGQVGAPPALGIPSLLDGFVGWFTGFIALFLPSCLLAWQCHRRLGHWRRYFAYWGHRSWWAVLGGSASTAVALWAMLGALPTWDRLWQRWDSVAQTQNPPSPQTLRWLDLTHAQFLLLLQAGDAVVLAASVAVLLLGMVTFTRRVLVRRKLPQPTPDWLMPEPPILH